MQGCLLPRFHLGVHLFPDSLRRIDKGVERSISASLPPRHRNPGGHDGNNPAILDGMRNDTPEPGLRRPIRLPVRERDPPPAFFHFQHDFPVVVIHGHVQHFPQHVNGIVERNGSVCFNSS